MSEKYSVIIIGAGISGIKTAIDLYKGGVTNILVLEARERLGGRLLSVRSQTYPELLYDYGAAWFHDALYNPLFDKAVASGDIEYYFDDGKHRYFSEKDAEVEPWVFSPIVEEIIAYISLVYHQDPTKPDMSLREICEEYVNRQKVHLSAKQIEYASSGVRALGELWHGESWDKLSAKQAFEGADHLGRNVLVKSGYSKVFERELSELPESFRKSRIRKGEPVKYIDYSSHDIKVETENHTYVTQYLVSSIAQSSYKVQDNSLGSIKWTPPLPAKFTQIIPSIRTGSLGKVIFEFSTCFWPQDVDRFYAITNKEVRDPKNPKAWDYPTLFLNYESYSKKPVLVALTQNPLSSTIENFDEATRNDKIWELFQPIIAQLAGVSSPPKPLSILHSSWNNDVWARGAYSTSGVDCIDTDDITDAFISGLNRKVRFAGAETVSGSANGCAHGGWFSGEREAKFILEDMKKSGAES